MIEHIGDLPAVLKNLDFCILAGKEAVLFYFGEELDLRISLAWSY